MNRDPLGASGMASCAVLCTQIVPEPEHGELLRGLRQVFPELAFRHVLTRGGWHRLGGVVSAQGQRIADNVTTWARQAYRGDLSALLANYADADYRVTRLQGRTHYLTAPCGPRPCDFVQLEVEEVLEVVDRPLVEVDRLPDCLEEFVDPLEYTPLAPDPASPPRYQFRRWLDVAVHVEALTSSDGECVPLRRFLADWEHSSAGETLAFCHCWVLSMQESVDRYGEAVVSMKPVPACTPSAPYPAPEPALSGARLANFIHGFDRALGYPMAWYFHLLAGGRVPYHIAQSVYDDQMGAYDYLPPRDLKILRTWVERPYAP